ncbi:hypothetical protein [Streptococcus oricebi]|uniref:Uncharacterized protein n=1 Tax=Streptococcus oricebi TaxID=1547447 RepID=A0ABS5B246_9STRE|nr:hypothetical protein [Streptococcus oricebi]MBP2622882.1 hypothetical protein [Streptococcus oricebi]
MKSTRKNLSSILNQPILYTVLLMSFELPYLVYLRVHSRSVSQMGTHWLEHVFKFFFDLIEGAYFGFLYLLAFALVIVIWVIYFSQKKKINKIANLRSYWIVFLSVLVICLIINGWFRELINYGIILSLLSIPVLIPIVLWKFFKSNSEDD